MEVAPTQLAQQIASRLAPPPGGSRIEIDGETLLRPDLVRTFYERRAYEPAWVEAGTLRPVALALRQVIAEADREGLDPVDYHWPSVDRVSSAAVRSLDPVTLTGLDILASDAFLAYAAHLVSGRIDPVALGVDWFIRRPQADVAWVLGRGLEMSLAEELEKLRPPHPGYERLGHALAAYREIERRGGWPRVPEGPTLRPGDRDTRVRVLRRRLQVTSDWRGDRSSTLYDETLAVAVRAFQTRHGLEPDAVLGPRTMLALNVPVRHRIEQILVNLERWRWLPLDIEERHIQVNVPAYRLTVYEAGAPVLQMPVIVGRMLRGTPVLSEQMTHIVFSPYWNIPRRLAVEDMLPKILQDSTYCDRNGIRVFRSWAADAQPVDAREIDWSHLHADSFPVRLRQDPGPLNLLGRVKFMFPNAHDIYIHDTPSRGLFGRSSRDLSSGCVRIADPVALAYFLLRDQPEWTRDSIRRAMAEKEPRTVNLRKPIRVDLMYWTAWADEIDTVHFRDDIYERDPLVLRALTSRTSF